MHSRFHTVFFDWGGVVANDPGDQFLSQILRDVGASEEQVGAIMHTYMQQFMRGQITDAQYWQTLRTEYRLAIPDSIDDEFLKWDGLNANMEIVTLIDEIRSHGIQTALLSNTVEPTCNALSRAGLLDHFDTLVTSWETGYTKPEKAIYETALTMLHTTAEASIFIDDKERNLTPAAAMGFTTVLAESPEQIIRDLRALLAPVFV